jgi:putative hydrolase of the HAD superfamily
VTCERAIVFDLDDTLYPYRAFLRSGFTAVGARLAAERGLSAPAVVRCLRDALRTPQRGRELQRLCEQFALPVDLIPMLKTTMRHHAPSLRLPGASRLVLTELRARWRVGVLTNGDPVVQRRKTEALRLGSFVDVVVFACECGDGFGKPAPQTFHTVLDRLEARPEAAVFVGNDVQADMMGASSVGMRTIHVGPDARDARRPCGSNACSAHAQSLRHVPELAEQLLRNERPDGSPLYESNHVS